MKIVKDKISLDEVKRLAEEQYGDMVKAVIDAEKGFMAVGGEFHSDAEKVLLEREDSKHEDCWGINIYPENLGNERVVFDSLINIKPLSNNRSLFVENEGIRLKIKEVVNKLIQW
ncbi:MAG: hypothetical protein A2365_02420 [Candidatus Nealsonbacteria bacterium RIFOXYB1_FULL_40_15]|uniref:Uncharacterized protein n=2 Tax=Candidatus Nealsoniibacteriota TaxID=1817911 RepID=A0A1G2EPD6_9BACT|nr:MAG: hypothetical protein A2365_02420 [Candidatus Nealsonbacteria bacterium RIFOXYB1_FULL_40_15]OGZ27656.1 MAG: hypothetical protein A2427_02745 [Candidatus Nealsonbacteria bacterium RIFOXYC1_FULL_40_7]OGZ28710.1 MAG: hypothetical protein A2562_00550 [Candidatus Nealsonbacteria bacterium RIFOXYD1_FULL_39_11]